jgi:hypothetical protein
MHTRSNDRCSRTSPPIGPGDRRASLGLPHHDAHTPSQGVGLYHDQEPSRSTACNVFFEEMPHLIDFHDDGLSSRVRLDVILRRTATDPFQDRTGVDAEHLAQRVHRDAVAVEKDR